MHNGYVKSTLTFALCTLIYFSPLLLADSAAQTPTWKAELLGTPIPSWSSVAAVAVNDAGQVVGNTYLSGYSRAWIAGPGQGLELLPLPPEATWSKAHDINASGVVVGQILFGSDSQAVIWQPGIGGYEAFLLSAGPGGHLPFDARGINDLGDVVGKYGILGGSYHWSEATGVTQITTATFPVVPYDVNEQRQIVGESYRMDLDTLVLEDLGDPTETTYHYVYTELTNINDAGECAGYAVVATSQPPYLPVRYTDGPEWKVFSSFPLVSASASGLSASGDTVFQLGIYGILLYVNGVGSIGLQSLLDPAYRDWDLTGSFVPAISRGGLLAGTGTNTVTGESGVVLLTPLAFEDLGGAARGELGDPVLSGYGSLLPGEPARLRLASAAPDSPVLLALSVRSTPVPLFGGLFHPTPGTRFFVGSTDALGRLDITFPWPAWPSVTPMYLQAVVIDPAAPGGVSLSNALRGETQ